MYVENHTKITNFPTPRVFNAPDEGVPVEFCIDAGVWRN